MKSNAECKIGNITFINYSDRVHPSILVWRSFELENSSICN